ncbi:toll/interleukin-1 receptor domain-containing protein [Rhodopseudomonas sp. P1]|uniref:toll/interleukin-1 receptor domain-containing protein n=1 Tax=Rhodopseudomonas sp. P1 TaxID=3434357 RepID=UPI0031FDAC9E
MAKEYQIGILGIPGAKLAIVEAAFRKQCSDLGLPPDAVALINEKDIGSRNRKRPFTGVFFGYPNATDVAHPILNDLLQDSVIILPVVENLESAAELIPPKLAHINCLESSIANPKIERIVNLAFESFRLLRSERRLFISYRRLESQGIAIQLYEALDALGFDVFLDTHSVPPAADFQSVLWHRLADSDVIVLLDTPDFRQSRWTVQELARANATSLQILHLLWPGVPPDPHSAFSEFVLLQAKHFFDSARTGPAARLEHSFIEEIGRNVEALRARAMAARYRYLVDNFCDMARNAGQQALVQSDRFVALTLANTRSIAVVPAIGVPSASRYQEIEEAILNAPVKYGKVWLLYDDRGLLQGWLDHVEWLNRHLPVTAVCVSACRSRIEREAA